MATQRTIKGWIWYYLFVDVSNDSMKEVLIQSDYEIEVKDSHMGIFMFTSKGAFFNMDEAKDKLGCGPLARIATVEEKRYICNQFNHNFQW